MYKFNYNVNNKITIKISCYPRCALCDPDCYYSPGSGHL